jgi:hypothetical protein
MNATANKSTHDKQEEKQEDRGVLQPLWAIKKGGINE